MRHFGFTRTCDRLWDAFALGIDWCRRLSFGPVETTDLYTRQCSLEISATVAPGKGGMGAFAPPLDSAGNSVKGQRAARFLSERLGLNLFASAPAGWTDGNEAEGDGKTSDDRIL